MTDINEIDIIKYLMQNSGHANGLIIKGKARLGKSTLLSLITKKALDDSPFIIVSNVRFENWVYEFYKDRIYFINSLRMYLEYYSIIPYENPILLVWDDSQASEGMTSKDVMSKEGKMFAKFLIFIGKMQTSYIYVAHQKYIPSALTEGFEPYFLYKLNRPQFVLSENQYLKDSDSIKDSINPIVNLPKPNVTKNEKGNYTIDDNDENYLPILSIAFTNFKFEGVDFDILFDMLTAFDVGENVKEVVKQYLGKSENENEYQELNLSYEKLYMALCIKKGRLISSGEKINELINDMMINSGRKKLRKLGLDFEK